MTKQAAKKPAATGAAAKKKTQKKTSLGDFLKDQAPQSSSWADEMDGGEDDYGEIPTDDLRGVLNKQTSTYTASRPFRDRDSQFEQGAEERSSSWGRTYDHAPREPREPREPRAAITEDRLPTEAPFVAYVGNLAFETTKDDLADFFESKGNIVVSEIILPVDRERGRIKGYGYLVVESLESLKEALKLNNDQFLGRNLRVDLTDESTAARVVTKREPRYDRDRQPRGDRPPREQTIADTSDNWRGGGLSDTADIFGRGKRNDNRNRRDRGEGDEFERRPRRDEIPFEQRFKTRRDDSSFESRPKRESAPKKSQDDIFGGKPWEETAELRDRVERLSVEQKSMVLTQKEQEAIEVQEPAEPRKQEDRSVRSNKKTIDFTNFQTKKERGGDRNDRSERGSSRGGRGAASTRGRGFNNKRDERPTAEKKERQPQEEKKPVKAAENAWSALEEVNDE